MILAGSGHSRDPAASTRNTGRLKMKTLVPLESVVGHERCHSARTAPRGTAALSRDSESVRKHPPSMFREPQSARCGRSLQATKLAMYAASRVSRGGSGSNTARGYAERVEGRESPIVIRAASTSHFFERYTDVVVRGGASIDRRDRQVGQCGLGAPRELRVCLNRQTRPPSW